MAGIYEIEISIPPKKEEMITKAAIKAGKTQSAYILDAVDEKLGLVNDREKTTRELAGWLSHDEAENLRKATDVFNQINTPSYSYHYKKRWLKYRSMMYGSQHPAWRQGERSLQEIGISRL
ncbi:MAG: hypothetical protein COW04_07970 [Deltaproteobacteria bacterium CG12_big_fil_rev_8_21_14_0_65_43_10]|nr:MAG: hypothetical protein AUK23_00615 [Deltaproteobacteria bacterium CG2_30_43_15]PIQ45364.1 MAG: hypothetical protein COW04_07970 [Deltaproteobacteria bacterium CG12_big_fil_rev_8_21_14_0_65_43_10]PIU86616.1 MAG: hypothetical protein COS67_01490 [Deltaproteobacteria bacterium CG06_land_8_20_14_3_00_44_19]PIX26701.1 MAG: hypothetical protein COZ68_00475 [Deltaproteobacteria bacterium CG_4_8_14_3_um_filter_43_13]PIZ20124.1 MAG: hypothetical protein COY50_06405 [Deltaproteobacteria bacterium C